MKRRSFITAAIIAACGALVAQSSIAPLPLLYADGAHDDKAALEAWFSGADVRWPNGESVGDKLAGRFYLSDTLNIGCRPTRRRELSDFRIDYADGGVIKGGSITVNG